MVKYRFKSKCPACYNNDEITWHHSTCPSYYKEYIDETGYVTCDCKKGSNIIFRRFNCGKHNIDHNDGYEPFLESRIYSIMAIAGTLNNDIPEEWRIQFMNNVREKWNENNPKKY